MPDNPNDTTITRLIRRKEETSARLRAAREAKGWSQLKLAEESEVALSSILKFEQGARPVTIEAAEAFQQVFDLPAAWFIDMMAAESLPVYCAAEGFRGDPGKIPVGRHTVPPSGAPSSPRARRRDAG